MIRKLSPFFVGFLFALGLGIGGMTRPEKVIGFLDVFGDWDATLVFVMIGAVGFHSVAYPLIRRRESPLFDVQWHVPERKDISAFLVFGSVLFGVGWALAGYCPGPALVSLASLRAEPFIFVFFMACGMIIFHFMNRKAANGQG